MAGGCLSDFSLPSLMGGSCRRSFWAKFVEKTPVVESYVLGMKHYPDISGL